MAIPAPRQRAVLAALLLEANQVVSVERLAGQLWGESPPRQARNTIQSLVLRLRRKLTPTDSARQNPVLVTQEPGYRLLVRAEQFDLNRFDGLVADARRALSIRAPETAAWTLRRALALWRGDPLADVAGVGLKQVDAPRLRERRLQAIEDRIEADLRLARHGDLIAEIPTLIAEHPLREGLYGQLMMALYGAGRQAEALDAFQVLRRRLVAELAVEPSPALQRLHQRILAQEPSLDPDRFRPDAGRAGASSTAPGA